MLGVLVLPRGAQGQAAGATVGMPVWQHPTDLVSLVQPKLDPALATGWVTASAAPQ